MLPCMSMCQSLNLIMSRRFQGGSGGSGPRGGDSGGGLFGGGTTQESYQNNTNNTKPVNIDNNGAPQAQGQLGVGSGRSASPTQLEVLTQKLAATRLLEPERLEAFKQAQQQLQQEQQVRYRCQLATSLRVAVFVLCSRNPQSYLNLEYQSCAVLWQFFAEALHPPFALCV